LSPLSESDNLALSCILKHLHFTYCGFQQPNFVHCPTLIVIQAWWYLLYYLLLVASYKILSMYI